MEPWSNLNSIFQSEFAFNVSAKNVYAINLI